MTPVRLAAVRVLVALDNGRTTLSAEVERERPDGANRRDQGLFLELVTGTTRWRAQVDAFLAPHCRRPLDELTPELRAVLRLAAYQLHHLDRIPEHAIVHESVEITRAVKQERATGFVNGVLRNLVRARSRPNPLPVRPADSMDTAATLAYLSVTLSHPRWLVERWLSRVGFEACERWCQFNNSAPDVAVRAIDCRSDDLLRRLREEGVDASAGQFAPGAVRLPAGVLGKLSRPTRDALVIQDEASQLVACLAGAAPGECVLDVCASPGGKTVILDRAVHPGGVVIAGDRRPARVALLRSTLKRAGAPVRVVALNAETGLPFRAVFDRVLLDAPCSGLGTVRRDPDIKWQRQPADLPRFAAAQGRMLARAAEVLKPGGALIYATCSSEPEENDEVVRDFLASSPGFRLAPIQPASSFEAAADVVDPRGMLRTVPYIHGLDAFFAAMLVRRDTA